MFGDVIVFRCEIEFRFRARFMHRLMRGYCQRIALGGHGFGGRKQL